MAEDNRPEEKEIEETEVQKDIKEIVRLLNKNNLTIDVEHRVKFVPKPSNTKNEVE